MSNKVAEAVANLERTNRFENEVKSQAEVIGALRQSNLDLRTQLLNDQKKVTITEQGQSVKTLDCYGSVIYSPGKFTISKVNMEDAVDLIAEKVNENNESEVKQLKETLKSKERHVADLEQSINDITAQRNRQVNDIKANYKEQSFQDKKSFEDSNTKLKHKVQELQEELVKVKEDKTDEQLEKTRKQEVANLKARIETLEREMKRLLDLSWIQRWWDRITKRTANIEAQKQVAREEILADSVRINSETQSNSKTSEPKGVYFDLRDICDTNACW